MRSITSDHDGIITLEFDFIIHLHTRFTAVIRTSTPQPPAPPIAHHHIQSMDNAMQSNGEEWQEKEGRRVVNIVEKDIKSKFMGEAKNMVNNNNIQWSAHSVR